MNIRRLKIITAILSLSVMLVLLVGCLNNKSGTKEKLEKVVVSEFRGLTYAQVHVADALGYFKEEGLDVEFAVYGDGPVAFQGMHAGDSQFCLLSIEPVFRAFEESLESVVIGAFDTSRLYGFAGSRNITDISQLKGKVVFAGAPGSAPFSFIWNLLEKGGLNPARDVTFAQMQYGASIAALDRETIDATYVDHYNKNKFLAVGANFIVDGADMETKKRVFGSEKFEGSIVTATKKYVEENPKTVQAFINALVKGARWLSSHSIEEIAPVLKPYHDGSSYEDLLERLSLIKVAYSPDCRISKEGYGAMEAFSLQTGVLKKEIGYENIINMDFVEKALGHQ